MATKPQGNAGDTGRIALLACVIVAALAALAFCYYRSNAPSDKGSSSGEVQQMQPGARGGGRRMTPH
jgi:hypothetical protein